MPTYNFKERFADFVKAKTKRQTVRAYRKDGRLPKKDENVNLFSGMRTRNCCRLNEPGIDKVIYTNTIVITATNVYISKYTFCKTDAHAILADGAYTNGKNDFIQLSEKEADRFAWYDGFRKENATTFSPVGSLALMLDFWKNTHQLPFIGTVTYW